MLPLHQTRLIVYDPDSMEDVRGIAPHGPPKPNMPVGMDLC